jgi:hypothetical protein
MIAEAFLICALSLPAVSFTWPPILAKSEQDHLVDFIRKHNPDAQVAVNRKRNGYGWTRLPFRWKGKSVWIKKPDSPKQRMIEASA